MIAVINTSLNHDKILSRSLLTYEVIQDWVHFWVLKDVTHDLITHARPMKISVPSVFDVLSSNLKRFSRYNLCFISYASHEKSRISLNNILVQPKISTDKIYARITDTWYKFTFSNHHCRVSGSPGGSNLAAFSLVSGFHRVNLWLVFIFWRFCFCVWN